MFCEHCAPTELWGVGFWNYKPGGPPACLLPTTTFNSTPVRLACGPWKTGGAPAAARRCGEKAATGRCPWGQRGPAAKRDRQKAKGKRRRQRMELIGTSTGRFNTGWKGRSARSPQLQDRPTQARSGPFHPLEVRRRLGANINSKNGYGSSGVKRQHKHRQ